MSIFVIGLNYKTAPITLREKVYFAADRLSLYLQDILSLSGIHEAVLLSTCHRSELYCSADHIEGARAWFLAQAPRHDVELEQALYVYRDQAAIAHIMRVATGLDSMVIGEPQIFGQIKEAYSESCASGAMGTVLHRLFQQVFAVSKTIRTTTTIGACPVSLASSAVHFAKTSLPDFEASQVALIGAGETAQLLIRYLAGAVKFPIQLVNRSSERAALLTADYPIQVREFEQLTPTLIDADIVFTATSSAIPIVDKMMMERVMEARNHRPIMLIDLAVPRNIEPTCTALDHVMLYCIDDLKEMIEKNRKGREHAKDKADECIHQSSQDLFIELQSLDKVAHTIRTYRGQIEALCNAELIKAKAVLKQGGEPSHVLDAFAYSFINKLMHAPSVNLRQAGKEGRFELLRFAKQLFALPDPETELL